MGIQHMTNLLLFMLKIEPVPEEQTPCHSRFPAGSFAFRGHLRSNLGVISGLKIICGAVQWKHFPHLLPRYIGNKYKKLI